MKKKIVKPKTVMLVILDENGQRTQDSFSLDVKLLKAQATTLGNIIDGAGGFVRVYEFTDAEHENVQGAWNLLHGILDLVES